MTREPHIHTPAQDPRIFLPMMSAPVCTQEADKLTEARILLQRTLDWLRGKTAHG